MKKKNRGLFILLVLTRFNLLILLIPNFNVDFFSFIFIRNLDNKELLKKALDRKGLNLYKEKDLEIL